MKTKEMMITDILQVCKVSQLSGKFMDMNSVFINLACASDEALIQICSELNIPVKT